MYAIVNEKGEYVGSTEIKEISNIPMPEDTLFANEKLCVFLQIFNNINSIV